MKGIIVPCGTASRTSTLGDAHIWAFLSTIFIPNMFHMAVKLWSRQLLHPVDLRYHLDQVIRDRIS